MSHHTLCDNCHRNLDDEDHITIRLDVSMKNISGRKPKSKDFCMSCFETVNLFEEMVTEDV